MQVERTDSRATYRVDLSTLGRPSRTCLLECEIRGTTLHMSETQMARTLSPLLERYTRLRSYSTGLKMVDWPKTLR